MDLVAILRVLALHRIALTAGVVAAVLAAVWTLYDVSFSDGLSERRAASFTASTRALLNAPAEPPTIDLDSGVTNTLGLRAELISDLMATAAVHARVSRAAGLRPDQLTILTPSMQRAPLPAPLGVSATEAARTIRTPAALLISADGSVPIVSISAAAPSSAMALRLSQSAVAGLQRLVATRAPGRALTVEGLGRARLDTRVSTPSRVHAAGVALAVLGLWSAAIVLVAGLARRRRSTGRHGLQPRFLVTRKPA